ncbi:uncharacterized protein LOC119975260 isoform X1 [Scyliorhinus canicula]|uniref:uncharacterized protein LOC119975260 isoform X1 n=1 Tax=Scyliorhinus canicula TaxID=7830 RepID=UPI0018F76309|nr:uncharacterized protein LOC119975260 isoform X1 [Scyliorhinus canicula]
MTVLIAVSHEYIKQVCIGETANITFEEYVATFPTPFLKHGMSKIVCIATNCSEPYSISFNNRSVSIYIHGVSSNHTGLYYLEHGNSKRIHFELVLNNDCPTPEPSETLMVDQDRQQNGSTDCPTPEPSETLMVDQDRQQNGSTGRGLSTGARAGLGIGISVSVVAGIVVFIILKRQSRKQNRHQINQNEASNGVSLTEVTCRGEARGLVTTAPEHQDGAAGEQDLLRNGIVQIPLH